MPTKEAPAKPIKRFEMPAFDELEFGYHKRDVSLHTGLDDWPYVRMDFNSEKDVRHVYGNRAHKLKASLARRMVVGQVYRALYGQSWWMLQTKGERTRSISSLRFLGYNPRNGARFETRGKDTYGFWAYPRKGALVTGSGSDPVYVFVQ